MAKPLGGGVAPFGFELAAAVGAPVAGDPGAGDVPFAGGAPAAGADADGVGPPPEAPPPTVGDGAPPTGGRAGALFTVGTGELPVAPPPEHAAVASTPKSAEVTNKHFFIDRFSSGTTREGRTDPPLRHWMYGESFFSDKSE